MCALRSLLAVINPNVGGVLLIGPARHGQNNNRSAQPERSSCREVEVSTCDEGCLPEDYERNGETAVCPELRGENSSCGEPITRWTAVKMTELPLNARLEDVVGGINERIALQQQRVRLERGISARADQNIPYVDEVNLLDDNDCGRHPERRGRCW